MSKIQTNPNGKFGTLPVFLTALSTILGAILFLRFGWAVGQVGFWGTIGIVILGHLVTVPTAMAVAEIATNQKVQGGGAYFIISRSFGLNIGAALGMTLFFSQAISVAFYVIAFGEAFRPILEWVGQFFPRMDTSFSQWITIPTMIILTSLMLTRGANMGMKALYWVVAILIGSLLVFFMGKSTIEPHQVDFNAHVANPRSFFYVFTIVFPAFTGLAAGLGLSGDLKNPEKSIPQGTIWATVVGLLVYILAAYKLVVSASPEDLANTQDIVMTKIALWGPAIPIGLAAASLSSALGSIMIAPRTLQAIGADDIFPSEKGNRWFSMCRASDNEPINASIVTIVIAFIFVIIGDVDFVAEIISMFFMITYATICLISLLEHFAADPAYRPTFKSHWVISLVGTLFSFWLMFKMNSLYATLAIAIMVGIYFFITKQKDEKQGFSKLFRGVIFQLSRKLQVIAQRADRDQPETGWRPFAICISEDTFKRHSAFDLMRWISYKYGFGTYMHFVKGFLNKETAYESKMSLSKLLKQSEDEQSSVYLDTIISPSYTSAIAQVAQLKGISGKGNNLILFEYSENDDSTIVNVTQNYEMLSSTGFDICILRTTLKGFGYKRELHIWIKPDDYKNATLMILLGYILLGHPEWKHAVIKIFTLAPASRMVEEKQKLTERIKKGRIPISEKNVEMVPLEESQNKAEVISKYSNASDLTLIGFHEKALTDASLFNDYVDIGNILFVCANDTKEIE